MGIMKEENMGVTKERGSLGGTSGTESPRVPRAGHAPPAASRAADIGAPFDEWLQLVRAMRRNVKKVANRAADVEWRVYRLEFGLQKLEELLAASRAATDPAAAINELLERVLEMQNEARKIAEQAPRFQAGVDRLVLELEELAAQLARAGAPQGEMPARRGRRRTRPEDERLLEAEAFRGVAAFEFQRHATGSAHVQIGDGAPMKLAPGQANLLETIAGNRPSDDHLVGWHPFDEVAARIGALEPRTVSRHALTQRIWRLREALDKAGVNWRYVQVHPQKGVRFALRRGGASPQSPARWIGDREELGVNSRERDPGTTPRGESAATWIGPPS